MRHQAQAFSFPNYKLLAGRLSLEKGPRIGLQFAFFSLTLLLELIRYPGQFLGCLPFRLVSTFKGLRVVPDCFLNKIRVHDTNFGTNTRQVNR